MPHQFVIEKLILDMEFGTEAEYHAFAQQPSAEWMAKLEAILQALFASYQGNYELEELILDMGVVPKTNGQNLGLDAMLQHTHLEVHPKAVLERPVANIANATNSGRHYPTHIPQLASHSLRTYLLHGQFLDTQLWSYTALCDYFAEPEQLRQSLRWVAHLPLRQGRAALQRLLSYLPPQAIKALIQEAAEWQVPVIRHYLALRQSLDTRGALEPTINPQLSPKSMDAFTAVPSDYFIGYAGLVILAPFLPALFNRLGLLDETQKAFVNLAAMHYAVHVLAFLASGKTLQSDHNTALLKVLSGLSPATPIVLPCELSADDIEKIEGLLLQITKNWEAGLNENINLLRGSFLFRDGKLSFDNNTWELRVDTKVYDSFLLRRVKWGFRLVKLPWMDCFLQTFWE